MSLIAAQQVRTRIIILYACMAWIGALKKILSQHTGTQHALRPCVNFARFSRNAKKIKHEQQTIIWLVKVVNQRTVSFAHVQSIATW